MKAVAEKKILKTQRIVTVNRKKSSNIGFKHSSIRRRQANKCIGFAKKKNELKRERKKKIKRKQLTQPSIG